ncbi:ZIP family metal transporter [Candidatus Uhrbacteria bacterium]|nr:ZIP family metal transporter [Candidatus Uhrbacteria bacterium]
MQTLLPALAAAAVMSLLSLVGYASLAWKKSQTAFVQHAIVAFAAGALLGNAFFHLLPESVETSPNALTWALAGILIFFVLDSMLWIYHSHAGRELHDHEHDHAPAKPVGYLNLIGDAVHNFTDGIAVMSAYLVNPVLGLNTAIAIGLHEIPQELGDFGILLSSGFSKKKALWLNLLVSFAMIVGVIGTWLAAGFVTRLTTWTIPLAAGFMIYMACTNLFSEIKEEPKLSTRAWQTLAMLLGLAIMWLTAGME